MPRRAVPARFMSNACSKNFAAASGSGTMRAMWRSLAMVSPFWQIRCAALAPVAPGHLAKTIAGAQMARRGCVPRRKRVNGWRWLPGGAAAASGLADRGAEGPLQHAPALVDLPQHRAVAGMRDV